MSGARRSMLAALAALGLAVAGGAHAQAAPSAAANASEAAASGADAAAGAAISPVEQWLFLDDHLGRLKLPNTLRYSYDVQGSLKTAEHYDLALALVRDKGKLSATLKHPRVETPIAVPVDGDLHNRILDYFLDRDVETMQQITGGKRNYFQRRIRMALAGASKIEPVRVDQGGRSVEARQVQFQPYLDDPLRSRFEKLAAKRYTFVLSKATPGEVLSIQTVVPGPNNDFANPLLTETLRFEGAR